MGDYFKRSIKELKRFKGRNLTSLIGITIIVMMITTLLNLSLQMDALFQQNNLDFLNKYRYIYISSAGTSIDEEAIEEIEGMDGIESVLPLRNPVGYPWVNITMGEYQILPVYISFFNQDYFADFFDEDIMVNISTESLGVIVSSKFRNNILSKEQYEEMFGAKESLPNELLSTSSVKAIEKYKDGNYPISQEKLEMQLVGKDLNVNIETKYVNDSITNKDLESTIKITGEIKEEYLLMRNDSILVPANQKGKFTYREDFPPVEYNALYYKTENIEDIPKITEELKEKGHMTGTDIDGLIDFLDEQQELINNIFIIMGIVIILAIFNFSNTMQSIIQERRSEIALMKALGASNYQIILGFLLEGILLIIFALIVGFTIVTAFFKTIIYMVNHEIIAPSTYRAFKLEAEAIQFILNIPLSTYLYIAVVTILLGVIVTLIATRKIFKENYLVLMNRGD